MMNLVTAVIVNTALEEASKDKEMVKAQEDKERLKRMKELTCLFERLDGDGSVIPIWHGLKIWFRFLSHRFRAKKKN